MRQPQLSTIVLSSTVVTSALSADPRSHRLNSLTHARACARAGVRLKKQRGPLRVLLLPPHQ
jgi:hypothetical protein